MIHLHLGLYTDEGVRRAQPMRQGMPITPPVDAHTAAEVLERHVDEYREEIRFTSWDNDTQTETESIIQAIPMHQWRGSRRASKA